MTVSTPVSFANTWWDLNNNNETWHFGKIMGCFSSKERPECWRRHLTSASLSTKGPKLAIGEVLDTGRPSCKLPTSLRCTHTHHYTPLPPPPTHTHTAEQSSKPSLLLHWVPHTLTRNFPTGQREFPLHYQLSLFHCLPRIVKSFHRVNQTCLVHLLALFYQLEIEPWLFLSASHVPQPVFHSLGHDNSHSLMAGIVNKLTSEVVPGFSPLTV